MTSHDQIRFAAFGTIAGDLLVVSRVDGDAVAERFDAKTGRLTWTVDLGPQANASTVIGSGRDDDVLVGIPLDDGTWTITSVSSGGTVLATQHWGNTGSLGIANGVMALSDGKTLEVSDFNSGVDKWTASAPVLGTPGTPAVSLDGDVALSWLDSGYLYVARYSSDGTMAWSQQVSAVYTIPQPRQPVVYATDGDLVIASNDDVASLQRRARDQTLRWTKEYVATDHSSGLALTETGDIVVAGGFAEAPQPPDYFSLDTDLGSLEWVAGNTGEPLRTARVYASVDGVTYGTELYAVLSVELLGVKP